MTVIKRDRNSSNSDLVGAVEKLIELLRGQDELDAIESLKLSLDGLRRNQPGTPKHKEAIDGIIDAFEGEHELMAYTFQREGTQWTEVEELSQVSSRVISLARRMRA